MYLGNGDSLFDRIWVKHMSQGRSLHSSAFRRNVAEHLGFGSANDIYHKVIRLSDEQRAAVRPWIVGCEVAWIDCDSVEEATIWRRRWSSTSGNRGT